jgi:hypothetical protein
MTTPGANIILDTKDHIGSGVYADIFRPSGGALVYKLFIGFRHHTTVSSPLRTHSSVTILRIPSSAARSPAFSNMAKASAPNLLACCYAMEYIEGTDVKLRAVEQFSHIRQAQSAFHCVGVAHISDASVFFAEDAQKFKFIDFAIEAFTPPPWLFKA